MKNSPVLGILIAGALFGWFAPDLAGPGQTFHVESQPATPTATKQPNKLDVVQPTQWPSQVTLPRASDGHFYADVTVQGVTRQMLIDTGATVIALTGEDARAIGVFWSDQDIAPVARGASGMVYGVPVTLNAVRIGGLEAQAVDAVVVPEGLGVSLLGQSFLSHVGKVEISGDQMMLGG
jgi:aspartyl protease family protein